MINANNNGMKLESETASLVTKYLSYAVEPYRTTKTKDNVLLKNAPYRSIYGRNSRTEFLLLHGGRRIKIQVFSLTQFEEYLSKGLPKKSLFTRLKEIFFHVHEYTNLQLCTFYHNT